MMQQPRPQCLLKYHETTSSNLKAISAHPTSLLISYPPANSCKIALFTYHSSHFYADFSGFPTITESAALATLDTALKYPFRSYRTVVSRLLLNRPPWPLPTQHSNIHLGVSRVNRLLPIAEALFWHLGVRALLQASIALCIACLVCPVVCILLTVAGLVRWLVRSVWDSIIFHCLLAHRTRVPRRGGIWVRHVAGPGTADNHFYQVNYQFSLSLFSLGYFPVTTFSSS
ncbi:unnamed protein product [Protopolystoma xenopodis]|uniref:Uncharacterized protein n=1 Tax=Protopolystoma xenopodis TaxID=117903 RepID=A0A448XHK0_9PLAT|nr:unnamed protein product [Protopolystoma xenopodis]